MAKNNAHVYVESFLISPKCAKKKKKNVVNKTEEMNFNCDDKSCIRILYVPMYSVGIIYIVHASTRIEPLQRRWWNRVHTD